MFSSGGYELHVCLGYCLEVGGVVLDFCDGDEVGYGYWQPLVRHAEVGMNEAAYLAGLCSVVEFGSGCVLGAAVHCAEASL